MDAITHLLTGYLLGRGLSAGEPALVALTTLFAVLPDFDTVTWVRPIRGVRHRGLTHSFAVGVPLAFAAAGALAALGVAPFLPALACALLGFLSHVTLDFLNWGCQLLWPWRPDRLHYTVQAGLRNTAIASFIGLAVITAAWRWAPSVAGTLELVVGVAFVAYLVVRLAMKWLAVRAHGPGARAFPTGNPLVWTVLPPGGSARRTHRLLTRPPRP